jgi:hypothetical protein
MTRACIVLTLVLNAAARPSLGTPQAVRHCADLLSDADASKATGAAGVKMMREATPKPDEIACGYGVNATFSFNVITGPRAKTASDNYEKGTSLLKTRVETVTGLGKRAWYDRSSAMLWVDTGNAAVSVVMGGKEGNPSVKGWLEAIARIVTSHL